MGGRRSRDLDLHWAERRLFMGASPNEASAQRVGWLGRLDSNLRMPESKSGALPLGYAPMISDLLARTLPLLPGFASERGISMWPLPTSPGRVLIADRNALSSLAAASSCIIGVRWLR